MSSLGRAASSALVCLLFGCASNSPSSGQTGSPNKEDPPSYDTPHPTPPGEGGGVGNHTAGPGGNNLLPHGKPHARAVEVDSVLLVGGPGLGLFDISGTDGPELVGRWQEDSLVVQIESSSLERVAVVASSDVELSQATIPEQTVPSQVTRLVELDASDPSAPRELRAVELSENTADVVATDSGYSLVGAGSTPSEQRCGVVYNESFGFGYPEDAWLSRLEPQGSSFALADDRHFGSGYFEISSDRRYAVFVPALDELSTDPVLEVVELDTLETVAKLTVPATALAPNDLHGVAADVRGDLAVLSGFGQLLLYDLVRGELVQTADAGAAVQGLSFVADDTVVVDGADGVFAVDRASDPIALEFLPASGRSAGLHVGVFRPFADGFVEVTATNQDRSTLVAVRYGAPDGGALVATDEVSTELPYYYAPEMSLGPQPFPWVVGDATLALDYEVYDDTRGADDYFLGTVTGGSDGALLVSDPIQLEGHYGDLVPFEGGVGYASTEAFEAFGVESNADGARLIPQGATRLGLIDVWFEVEHAGLVFAKHRNSYGRTDVSYRPSGSFAPTFLDVPHRTDALVPLDATHLAVVGLATGSECQGAEAIPECGIGGTGLVQPNGLSVLAIDGTDARVVGSSGLEPKGSSPPEGIQRRLDWTGFLPLTSEQWLLVARVQDSCNSFESCETLGVEPFVDDGSFSSPGSEGECVDGDCTPQPDPTQPWVSGYKQSTWLVPLSLEDPEHPTLAKPTEGGIESDLYDETKRRSLAPQLLHAPDSGELDVWGYAWEQPLYGPEGNSLPNQYGDPVSKNWLQLFSLKNGKATFKDAINVPGQVLLLGSAEWAHSDDARYSAFSLGAAYRDEGQPYFTLSRLSVESDRAIVTETLELESAAYDGWAQGSRVALLQRPLDPCESDASYSLTVVDADGDDLVRSTPLELAPGSWGFDRSGEPSSDPDLLYVAGGPAYGRARAVVDIGQDPPKLVRYETYEW
jgi:hypothetical protein